MRLQNKVALITGVSSGIGRAAALLFAAEGAAVVLGSRRSQEGEALVVEIKKRGGRALFRTTDVKEERDHQALVELALSEYDRLDIAFNNAGVEATGHFLDFDPETYANVFDTNVRGIFLAIRAQQTALSHSKGSIILTSSTAGSRGFPGAGIYTASKHAVEGIMRAAALELASSGVRVNAVAPGPTETPMLDRFTGGHPELLAARVPMGRVGTPEEVAQAALWLASDASQFVTGTVLAVNGGLTA